MGLEAKIERKVVSWAKAHDIVPLKLTPMQDGGWPDHFWLFHYPAIAFIEFKAPGRKPDPRQEYRISELRRRGYPVGVFDDFDAAVAFLEASLLSRTGGPTWDHTSMRWIPPQTGDGQDDYLLRDRIHPKG